MNQNDPKWSTTKTIATVKDAVEQALDSSQERGLVEQKIPLKAAVGLSVFLLTQALALAGAYYDLRGDVRSLQEAQSDLDALAAESDLDVVKDRIERLNETIAEIESDMKTPPTSMDHMRVIGEIKADVRLLEQRIEWLERKR